MEEYKKNNSDFNFIEKTLLESKELNEIEEWALKQKFIVKTQKIYTLRFPILELQLFRDYKLSLLIMNNKIEIALKKVLMFENKGYDVMDWMVEGDKELDYDNDGIKKFNTINQAKKEILRLVNKMGFK